MARRVGLRPEHIGPGAVVEAEVHAGNGLAVPVPDGAGDEPARAELEVLASRHGVQRHCHGRRACRVRAAGQVVVELVYVALRAGGSDVVRARGQAPGDVGAGRVGRAVPVIEALPRGIPDRNGDVGERRAAAVHGDVPRDLAAADEREIGAVCRVADGDGHGGTDGVAAVEVEHVGIVGLDVSAESVGLDVVRIPPRAPTTCRCRTCRSRRSRHSAPRCRRTRCRRR